MAQCPDDKEDSLCEQTNSKAQTSSLKDKQAKNTHSQSFALDRQELSQSSQTGQTRAFKENIQNPEIHKPGHHTCILNSTLGNWDFS